MYGPEAGMSSLLKPFHLFVQKSPALDSWAGSPVGASLVMSAMPVCFSRMCAGRIWTPLNRPL